MAGKITVSTINDSSGVLATQNGMTGIAKAWVNYKGTATVAIRDSFNVSSVTVNGTGDYTFNFTTAMANANYSCVATLGGTTVVVADLTLVGTTAPTTSAIRIGTRQTTTGNLIDCAYVCASVFSS